jgi:acylphosphatase
LFVYCHYLAIANPRSTFTITNNKHPIMKHIQLIISGNVEDTGFRFYALRGARMLGIFGCVLLRNGQLVVEAEGEERRLDAFIEWCRKGPESATVSSLVTNEKPVFGYDDFKIL